MPTPVSSSFMLHKLYALVDGGCCDDNADALVHHELLLPGHLLTMFLKVTPVAPLPESSAK